MLVTLPEQATSIVTSFQASIPQWQQAVHGPALFLFGFLAIVGTSVKLWREFLGGDLSYPRVAVIMAATMMELAIFYTIFEHGPQWSWQIIDSFRTVGARGAGVSGLSPGDIVGSGINLAWSLLSTADTISSGWNLGNLGTALVMVIAALLIFLSFLLIAFSYMIVLVEGYAAMTIGWFMLSFGAWSVTRDYVTRYIGLLVAIGIKVMTLFFVIATGRALVIGWKTDALTLGVVANPGEVVLSILGGSLMYALLAWHVPKLVASVMGGALHMGAGDFIGTGGMIASYTAMTASSSVSSIVSRATAAMGGGSVGVGASAGGGGGSQSITPTHVSPPSPNGHAKAGK